MNIAFFKHCWLVALKGMCLLVIGLISLFIPVESIEALLVYFGILIGLGGIFLLFFASHVKGQLRNWFLFEGIIDLLIAILLIFFSLKFAFTLAFILGIWLVINSLIRLYRARKLYLINEEWATTTANCVLTFTLGMMVVSHPISGILSLAYLFGLSTSLFGIFLILTAFRWRKHQLRKN